MIERPICLDFPSHFGAHSNLASGAYTPLDPPSYGTVSGSPNYIVGLTFSDSSNSVWHGLCPSGVMICPETRFPDNRMSTFQVSI